MHSIRSWGSSNLEVLHGTQATIAHHEEDVHILSRVSQVSKRSRELVP